jgi:outer membrane protein TolC
MGKAILRIIILWMLVLYGAPMAHAEEYTLDQLLTMARNYWAERLRSSEVDAQTAKKQAENTYFPNLNASFDVNKDLLADPSDDLQGQTTIGLSQQIFSFSDLKSIQARQLDLQAQICLVEAQQLQIAQAIINDYIAVQSNIDENNLQKQQLDLTQKALSVLRETVDLKLASKSDLALAEADLYQIQIQRAQIQAAKVQSLNSLRGQLGVNPKMDLDVNASFIEPKVNVAAWDKWAAIQPTIRAQNLQIQALQTDIQAIETEVVPFVSAGLSYNSATLGFNNNGIDDSLLAFSSIGIPIFDQRSRYVRSRQSKKQLAIAQLQFEASLNQTANQIAAVVVQLKANQIALQQAKKQMQSSQVAYDGALALFSLGRNNYFNLQNAQNLIINSRRQWLQIKRNIDQNLYTLKVLQEAGQQCVL